MSENPANPERSRRIDTRKYFVQDMVRDKLLKLYKVAGPNNVADSLTKSMESSVLRECIRKGEYALYDEFSNLKSRLDKRTQHKWYQQQIDPDSKNPQK